MQAILQQLQYAHWMMMAGTFFVMVGFLGLALKKSKEPTNPR
jgi:hypothetical protein